MLENFRTGLLQRSLPRRRSGNIGNDSGNIGNDSGNVGNTVAKNTSSTLPVYLDGAIQGPDALPSLR